MDFISIVASVFFIFLVPMGAVAIHWLGARVVGGGEEAPIDLASDRIGLLEVGVVVVK